MTEKTVKTCNATPIQIDWALHTLQNKEVTLVMCDGQPNIWPSSGVIDPRIVGGEPTLDAHGLPRFIAHGHPVRLDRVALGSFLADDRLAGALIDAHGVSTAHKTLPGGESWWTAKYKHPKTGYVTEVYGSDRKKAAIYAFLLGFMPMLTLPAELFIDDSTLKRFVVSLIEEANTSDDAISFVCHAVDAEHANEQAENAYPGCSLLACKRIDMWPEHYRFLIFSFSEASTVSGDEGDQSDVGGYWSNQDGWTTLDNATLFSEEERAVFTLPLSSGNDSTWLTHTDMVHVG